jgi:thiamine-phosphate pyrophosphorylase
VLHQTRRIIDANCNRIGEGLRFLEDVARFILNDEKLSQQLKSTRHEVIHNLSSLGIDTLSTRDAFGDVGRDNESISHQEDLPSLVKANSKRVQEALRVVEELAKLPDISPNLTSDKFESTRFAMYTIEQQLISKLQRLDKIQRLFGLYVILDTQTLGQRDIFEVAEKVISGGASVIQLRDKQREKGELLNIAHNLADLCRQTNILFIINDYLDIAIAANADGIHVGQDDLPVNAIKKQMSIDKIVGISVNTLNEAQKAHGGGADYIAVGSVFSSSTKKNAKVVGINTLRTIRQKISLPIVAIGGINEQNIGEVMASGAVAAAVISAVISEEDIENTTRRLVKEIEQNK